MLPGVFASHSQKVSSDKNLHLSRRARGLSSDVRGLETPLRNVQSLLKREDLSMSCRFLASTSVMAFLLVASLVAQAPPAAKQAAAKGKSANIPKTPDGHPDLQGVWTNATITPLERPK